MRVFSTSNFDFPPNFYLWIGIQFSKNEMVFLMLKVWKLEQLASRNFYSDFPPGPCIKIEAKL